MTPAPAASRQQQLPPDHIRVMQMTRPSAVTQMVSAVQSVLSAVMTIGYSPPGIIADRAPASSISLTV
jgi:hypothetical protein